MGSKKNVDMSANTDTVKVVKSTTPEVDLNNNIEPTKKKKEHKKNRSKKYIASKARVDRTKKYSTKDAVTLIKKLSYSKFDGTVTLDAVVKETGKLGNFSLPHSTGKTIKVVIVNDAVLEDIKAGNINFDALITTPAYMPKIAKFARVLGPKGLMPNPKNGTVTAKPEVKKAELEKGSFDLKTEKKAPVIHVTIGKVSSADKDLVENINYLITALKSKLTQVSISATMSPSVKIELN